VLAHLRGGERPKVQYVGDGERFKEESKVVRVER
jgi:hypothetical protein